MKTLICYILILCSIQIVVAQQKVTGRVTSAQTKEALPGATIKVKDTFRGITTNAEGRFTLQASEGEVLVISFLGYKSVEMKVPSSPSELSVELEEDHGTLKEVVVSTGYQDIPKERATGSFVTVDSELLNRRVSTDIISRLEDVVPGLVFNRKGPGQISIRGQSTLFGNAQPLVVIDNFPYDGDLNNLNPADVESISVLKDAAAASIWGTRAGNGVIVITTKRGAYNRPAKISFNSNLMVGAKPDLFYQPRMSSAEFIENEKALFDRGYYKSTENSSAKTPLTPAVELLIAKRDGRLDATQADAQLEQLKLYDVRNDLERYMYRESLNQQYVLSMEGGAENHRYFVSGGHDRNLEGLRGNSYSRTSLKASGTNAFFKRKLEVTTGISYINNNKLVNNEGVSALSLSPGVSVYPYARLADDAGNPLSIVKDYRQNYLDQVPQLSPELLTWRYTPLEELTLADNRQNEADLRLNAGVKYKITSALAVEGLYQYQGNFISGRNHHAQDSYYSRNLINLFSGSTNGQFNRAIPVGGILDLTDGRAAGHNLRGQLSYQGNWKLKHSLTALAGAEMRDLHHVSRSSRLYGYDDNLAVSTPVDYLSAFPSYVNPFTTLRISSNEGQQDLTDRYLSYYGNGAYTYNGRYTLSASARLDQSNLFGVKSNQKGVPLWSAGAAWEMSSEPFYNLSWLPYLKMRLTYGYNGNINKSLSAYTTSSYFSGAYRTNLPYATIVNAPNPELRWERVKMMNAALDFETRSRILSGSVEFYQKKGLDLIGDAPFPPSSGITSFRGNTADIKGHGVDLSLTSRNLDGKLKWSSSFLLSYATDEVSDYQVNSTAGNYVQLADGFAFPMAGRPLYSLYSYQWAGLNPQTGDPQGYLDGQVSSDYSNIISGTTPENMVYNGPSRPTVFGAFRNTFSWNGFSLSANVSYRLGYYFRRSSVNYFQVLNGRVSHGDYSLRWQKPGDEMHTSVPSMPASALSARDNLYLYSQALVEKGDHIRLQDINLSYQLNKARLPQLPFSGAEIFIYANNLGMIWQANTSGIDPDYQTGPPPITIAGGLRLQL